MNLQTKNEVSGIRVWVIWAFIISATFPKGIGFSLLGNNIDVCKMLYLFALLLTVYALQQSRLHFGLESAGILAFIIFAIAFIPFWQDPLQYFFFIYYLIFYISAFWLAKYIFDEPKFFVYFTNKISLAYIIVGLLALLDHYFKFIPIGLLRPENESFAYVYTRGDVAGIGEIAAYKGFDSVTHWFAMDRFVWLSLALCAYWFACNNKKYGFNKNILRASFLLGVAEVILSQARLLSVIVIAMLPISVVKNGKGTTGKLWIFLMAAAGSIILITYFDVFMYYIYAVSSIFSIVGLESGSSVPYVLESDKRYLALNAFFGSIAEGRIFLSYGPLFYSFIDQMLDVPSEYFDDLSPLIGSFLEFGVLAWLSVVFLVLWALLKNKTPLGWAIFITFVMVLGSSLANFSPRFYFYFFFFLGAAFSGAARLRN